MAWAQTRQADTVPATIAAPPGGPRSTRWLLVVVVLLHAAAAVAQPLLAGRYFSGDVDSMSTHSLNGTILLPTLCLVQFVAAVLFWRPGRGPGWPILVTVVLFLAEGLQIGMGYSRTLDVHIPLGVGIVSTCIGMAVWSLVWRPRPRKRALGPPPGPPMSYAALPGSHSSRPGAPWS